MSLELNRNELKDPRCPFCGNVLYWWRTVAVQDDTFDGLFSCNKSDCKLVSVRLRLPVERYDSHLHQLSPIPKSEDSQHTIRLDERYPIISRN